MAALLLPLSALAVPFDFTTVGSNNTNVGLSVSDGGVTADGFDLTAATTAPLWLRNETNDHGLGVCSEGDDACKSGGGDVNELTNGADQEAIRLTSPLGSIWTSLWVSSLDSGGSNSAERGVLLWSTNASSFSFGNSFSFGFGDFGGSVEGDLLTLAAAVGFDPTARYLLFINDPANGAAGDGANNDYLVWKGATEPPQLQVPEPGSIALLGAALTAFIFGRRKRA
ncbi:MAG: PEP-CTERM sorting domain-containing protein [Casimicrobiaceae bacterium]